MISFSACTRGYRGGRSSEFAEGILVRDGDLDLTGEGMGIGSVALRTTDFTYFPQNSRTVHHNDDVSRIFLLDTRIVWRFWGITSVWLTGLMEKLVTWYMTHPSLQNVFLPLCGLRGVARLETAPEVMEPVAEAQFFYRVKGSAIQISCTVQSLQGPLPEVWLLNELAADIFTASLQEDRLLPPPPGWEALNGALPTPALYDPSRSLWFRVARVMTAPSVTSRVYWGRERGKELNWAGFGIRLDPRGSVKVGCTYCIEFGGTGATGMTLI